MISIRPYVPTDYESVRKLYEMPGTFGGQFDADRDSKERLDEQSAQVVNSILIAEDGGRIVNGNPRSSRRVSLYDSRLRLPGSQR